VSVVRVVVQTLWDNLTLTVVAFVVEGQFDPLAW
jgi:hypothetical protein